MLIRTRMEAHGKVNCQAGAGKEKGRTTKSVTIVVAETILRAAAAQVNIILRSTTQQLLETDDACGCFGAAKEPQASCRLAEHFVEAKR